MTPKTFAEMQDQINLAITNDYQNGMFDWNTFQNTHETPISNACNYALAGGKRLRSIIVNEVARLTKHGNFTHVNTMPSALAIEYIHNASLIVDDLPVFDDDVIRRGQQTVHAKDGVIVAHLASMSMICAAMKNLSAQVQCMHDSVKMTCRNRRVPPEKCVEVWQRGARMYDYFWDRLDHKGIVGGQFMDSIPLIEDLQKAYGTNAVLDSIYRKTASLYEVSVVLGFLSAGGDMNQLPPIEALGRHFGLAFQIADDIGDRETDKDKRCWNVALVYGVEVARRLLDFHLSACSRLLESTGLRSALWGEVFQKLMTMTV